MKCDRRENPSIKRVNRWWNDFLSTLAQDGIVRPRNTSSGEEDSFRRFLEDRADEGWIESSPHLDGGWQISDRAFAFVQLSPRALYQHRRGIPYEELRENIAERDGHRCTLCRQFEFQIKQSGYNLQIHHIKPERDGGADVPENLCTVCQSCHRNVVHGHGIRLSPEVGEGPGISWLARRFLEEMAIIDVGYLFERDSLPYRPSHFVKTLRQLEQRGLVRRLELETHPGRRRHTYCVEVDHENIYIQYPYEDREEFRTRIEDEFHYL